MSKVVISLVPLDSKQFKYNIKDQIFEGYSTIEAISQYYLKNGENFKIILLKPESIPESQASSLIERIVNCGVNKENIILEEIPVKGYYNGTYYEVDNTITSDLIFLTLQEYIKQGVKEVILDVSRGLNFLVLLTVEAFRRFITSQKAKYYQYKEIIPKFYYVYATPEQENGSYVNFEEAKTPLFVDYFGNYNKIPFEFESNNENLYKEFNFTKEIIKQVNDCIHTIKRGYALAFLTIISWNDVKKNLDLAYEKLTIKNIKNLINYLTEIRENSKIIKIKSKYPLGNLWIYINFLEVFYSIYESYKEFIKDEKNRNWVKLDTLKKFNEEIIKDLFKENGAHLLLKNELNNFEKAFKKGETIEKDRSPNYERNFEAHAGLIYEFLDQDPNNLRVSYKFNEVLDKENEIKLITDYIKDFLRSWRPS